MVATQTMTKISSSIFKLIVNLTLDTFHIDTLFKVIKQMGDSLVDMLYIGNAYNIG
jgi:hypothetical protein